MSAVAQPLPWYARPAAGIVLLAAMVMSAPGEYALAVLAGWSPTVAWLMPVCVSVYAAVAALFVDSRPKGAPGRGTAIAGAAGALALALAAQDVAHLIALDYMESSAILVAAVSAVPPVVVAHIMHMVTRVAVAAQEESAVTPEELVENQEDAAAQDSDAELEPVTLRLVPGGADAPVDEEDAPETLFPTPDEAPEPDEAPKASTPGPSSRSLEEIRTAVALLKADGQEVNGATYGRLVGVSARTGRRDLKLLAA
ncbi:hypothetical protein WEB32_29825 [Streptomyces netropsis]|uniref:hypothetical protein n=1 Tax=Streptomyces netropsis TaxID=55404 RepID=UPI0030CF7CEC